MGFRLKPVQQTLEAETKQTMKQRIRKLMTYLLVGLIVLGVVGYFGLPHIFTA